MHKLDQKKIMTFCSYVPQELITAAGMSSFRYAGVWSQTKNAGSYLASNTCSYTHCAFDYLAEHAEEIAGAVFVNSCHAMEGLYQTVKQYLTIPCFILDVPRKVSQEAENYLYQSFYQLKIFLEQISDTEISSERVLDAIQKFNRDLAQATNHLGTSHSRPRILLSGNLCTPYDIVQTIAQYGGNVVVQDTCDDFRSKPVQIEEEGDLLRALARAYLQKPACPRLIGLDKRLSEFMELIKTQEIDGVIFSVLKFCPYQTYSTLALMEVLRTQEIPYLFCESEYVPESSGQLETRIQAFLECLV